MRRTQVVVGEAAPSPLAETRDRLGKLLEELAQKRDAKQVEVGLSKTLALVAAVSPVVGQDLVNPRDLPVKRQYEPEEIVVAEGEVGFAEPQVAPGHDLAPEERGERPDEAPTHEERDQHVALGFRVPIAPRDRFAGLRNERHLAAVDEPDI